MDSNEALSCQTSKELDIKNDIDSDFNPRPYQLEMYELAKKNNVIVKLNTGTGKTFIGIMLIKYHLWQTEKPLSQGGKRIFFIVKNVHLVQQQAASIRSHLPYSDSEKAVGEYYGQIKPGVWLDFWDAETWTRVFQSHRVIVITAGVFKDILNHAKFSLKHVALLILDECHHAAKEDDYVMICKHLKPASRGPDENAPRVLGLTACVVNGNVSPNRIGESVKQLEWNLRSRVVTSRHSLSHSRVGGDGVKEEFWTHNSEAHLDDRGVVEINRVISKGLELITQIIQVLKLEKPSEAPGLRQVEDNLPSKVKSAFQDCQSVLKELGPWCCMQVVRVYMREMDQVKPNPGSRDSGSKSLTLLTKVLSAVEVIYNRYVSDRPDPWVTDKCVQLVAIIKTHLERFESMSRTDNSASLSSSARISDASSHMSLLSARSSSPTSSVYFSDCASSPDCTSVPETTSSKGDPLSVTSNISDQSSQPTKSLITSDLIGPTSCPVLQPSTNVPEQTESSTLLDVKGKSIQPNEFATKSTENDSEMEDFNFDFLSDFNTDNEDDDVEDMEIHSSLSVPLEPLQISCNESGNTLSCSSDISSSSSIPIPSNNPPLLASTISSESSKSPYKGFACLVFVKQRMYAYALKCYLEYMISFLKELEYLNIGYVTGHGSSGSKETHTTMANQAKILSDFRKGKINLLIATSVVEEGMDVQKCNIVIKTNIPEEFRSYVQSKGRARAKNSTYIVMIPQENRGASEHKMALFLKVDEALSQALMSRVVDYEEEFVLPMGVYQDDPQDIFMPLGENGPRVTLNTAMSLINRYISKLRQDSILPLKAHVEFESAPPFGVRTIITLPMPSPLRQPIQGDVAQNKRLARQKCALRVCRLLYEAGELDESILPRDPVKQIEGKLSEVLTSAYGSDAGLKKTKRDYPVSTARLLSSPYQQTFVKNRDLYLYSIEMSRFPGDVMNLEDANFTHKDLLLGLVFTHLIANDDSEYIARFPLFFEADKLYVSIKFRCILEGNMITPYEINLMDRCHMALVTSYMNQCRKRDYVDKNLLFDPSGKQPWRIAVISNKEHNIDWKMTEHLAKHSVPTLNLAPLVRLPLPPLTTLSPNLMYGALVRTIHNPKELGFFLVQEPLTNLTVESQMNKSTTFRRHFLDTFHKSLPPGPIPLISLKRLPSPLNLLCPTVASGGKSSASSSKVRRLHDNAIFLPAEFCVVLPLPATLWIHLCALPFAIYRLNQLLLLQELHQEIHSAIEVSSNLKYPLQMEDLGRKKNSEDSKSPAKKQSNSPRTSESSPPNLNISLTQLMQATTLLHCHDHYDLEYLETLGDSYLKFITSKFLFAFCSDSEGVLTQLRAQRISNSNLFCLARVKHLDRYLKSRAFTPRSLFMPPSFRVASPVSGEDKRREWRNISDKSLADAVEALIGCVWVYGDMTGDHTLATKFLIWLGVELIPRTKPKTSTTAPKTAVNSSSETPNTSTDCTVAACANPDDDQNAYLQKLKATIYTFPSPKDPLIVERTPEALTRLEQLCVGFDKLEDILEYRFQRREFALEALTHASCTDNSLTGCYQRLEFLGDAVLDFLVTTFIFKENPNMSPGQLTDLRIALVNNTLFAVLAVRWNLHLFLNHTDPALFEYIKRFAEAQKENNYNTQYDELTVLSFDNNNEQKTVKILADIIESLAGAVFLDSGYCLQSTWRVFSRLMEEPIKDFSKNVPINMVRKFHERFSNLSFSEPVILENKFVRLTAYFGKKAGKTVENKSVKLCKLALAKMYLKPEQACVESISL